MPRLKRTDRKASHNAVRDSISEPLNCFAPTKVHPGAQPRGVSEDVFLLLVNDGNGITLSQRSGTVKLPQPITLNLLWHYMILPDGKFEFVKYIHQVHAGKDDDRVLICRHDWHPGVKDRPYPHVHVPSQHDESGDFHHPAEGPVDILDLLIFVCDDLGVPPLPHKAVEWAAMRDEHLGKWK